MGILLIGVIWFIFWLIHSAFGSTGVIITLLFLILLSLNED